MLSLFFLRSALRPLGLLTVLLLGLTACESGPRGHRGRPPEDGGPNVATPVPAMEARASFFQNQIDAEIILNRTGFGQHGSGRGGASNDAPSGGGGRAEGGGGGARGGGRGRRGGPMGGGEGSGGGGGGESRGDPDGRTANIRASNEAPVSFHLRLTNHGTAPIDVEVADFNSELGNFVVQPAKITLPVNEAVEMDPMISRLGLRDAEIPLTIRLRTGGKSETQVLTLRPISSPPPDATTPASQLPSVVAPTP